MFSSSSFQGNAPVSAQGTQLATGTWLALTGTSTANVNMPGGPGTRYQPGLFIRIS